MDNHNRNRIRELSTKNIKLERLFKRHLTLEERVSAFERRNFLTPIEQMELKRLKQSKLHGVDKMMEIVQTQAVGNL